MRELIQIPENVEIETKSFFRPTMTTSSIPRKEIPTTTNTRGKFK